MKVIWVTLALLGNLGVLHAQNKFSANAELPGHIKSVSGKVVLVADFTHKDTEGKIPVYLINGSEKSIKLMAQDGDVYLKLETRDEDGKWRRAQPHAFSWCGNSYYEETLLPKHSIHFDFPLFEGTVKTKMCAIIDYQVKVSRAGTEPAIS